MCYWKIYIISFIFENVFKNFVYYIFEFAFKNFAYYIFKFLKNLKKKTSTSTILG